MGELHLEIVVDRMKREFGVAANVGKPQVAYRETIRKAVEQEGRFVRQTRRPRPIRARLAAARAAAGRAMATSSSTAVEHGSVPASSCVPSSKAFASRWRKA